jgi:[ribosomal protein S18]-alanine N-acetyltransferase
MAVPIIDRMVPEDVDNFMVIERQSFHQPWSRHMYLMDVKSNQLATYLVARPAPGDRDTLPPILAYGGFWLMVDEAHVATIASHPDWRGCGLGHAVLLALIDAANARGAERSTLEVRVSNTVARRLYEQVGYRWAGTRRRYYYDGEDALIMTTPPFSDPAMQARLAEQKLAARARLEACFVDGLSPSGQAPPAGEES